MARTRPPLRRLGDKPRDTFAVGILNGVLGLGIPIVVAPYAKPALAAHPALQRSLLTLREWGVTVLPNEILRPEHANPAERAESFNWSPVVAAIVT